MTATTLGFDAPPEDDLAEHYLPRRTKLVPVVSHGWSDAELSKAAQLTGQRCYRKGLRNGYSAGWWRGLGAGLVAGSGLWLPAFVWWLVAN